MNRGYWLRVTERQLLYIIEGCEIDKPLAKHWAKHFRKSLLLKGEGQMMQVITSLEKKAKKALREGGGFNAYPPGDKRRRVMVDH